MDTFRMRLLVLFSPNCLFWLLVVAGGGYILIAAFGASQVAEFTLKLPYLAPMEAFIQERLWGRYSSLASGWALSTFVFFWGYIGRQLKRAERLC